VWVAVGLVRGRFSLSFALLCIEEALCLSAEGRRALAVTRRSERMRARRPLQRGVRRLDKLAGCRGPGECHHRQRLISTAGLRARRTEKPWA
jgi:hypothetical protein